MVKKLSEYEKLAYDAIEEMVPEMIGQKIVKWVYEMEVHSKHSLFASNEYFSKKFGWQGKTTARNAVMFAKKSGLISVEYLGNKFNRYSKNNRLLELNQQLLRLKMDEIEVSRRIQDELRAKYLAEKKADWEKFYAELDAKRQAYDEFNDEFDDEDDEFNDELDDELDDGLVFDTKNTTKNDVKTSDIVDNNTTDDVKKESQKHHEKTEKMAGKNAKNSAKNDAILQAPGYSPEYDSEYVPEYAQNTLNPVFTGVNFGEVAPNTNTKYIKTKKNKKKSDCLTARKLARDTIAKTANLASSANPKLGVDAEFHSGVENTTSLHSQLSSNFHSSLTPTPPKSAAPPRPHSAQALTRLASAARKLARDKSNKLNHQTRTAIMSDAARLRFGRKEKQERLEVMLEYFDGDIGLLLSAILGYLQSGGYDKQDGGEVKHYAPSLSWLFSTQKIDYVNSMLEKFISEDDLIRLTAEDETTTETSEGGAR